MMSTQSIHILIVEDDEALREALLDTAEMAGFEVTGAGDGSAALDLCYVAAGRLDGYWEPKLKPWDVAAGLLLVEEAGGRTSDFAGGAAPASGVEVVATNGALHGALLEAIGGSGRADMGPA